MATTTASSSINSPDGDVTVSASLHHNPSQSSLQQPKHDAPSHSLDRWTLRRWPWRRYVTPLSQLVEHEYEGKGTAEDPYKITWIENDAENPFNQPIASRWTLLVFVSISTLCVSFASSVYSGMVKSVAMTLGGSQTVIILGISFYVIGFALGPLVVGPCSEVIGRRNTFLISFALFTLWNGVAIASPNLAALLVFRFFAGACGSCPLTNSGGVIADAFTAKDRGLAMTIFSACVFLGPPLGPIVGGFLAEAAGWKWVMGLTTIFSGVVLIIAFFIHTETYAPTLLRQRAIRMTRATGKEYVSKADMGKNISFAYQMKIAFGRPWLLFFYEPIVLLLSLYVSVVYAILYSFFSAFPIVYEEVRGWSTGVAGLAFTGVLVGMLLAAVFQAVYINPRYYKTLQRYGGILAPPEERLPPAIWGAFLMVIGLAGFAATTSPSVHWSASIIFSGVFGCGAVMIMVALQSYTIDAYLLYAASVLAAASVIRSTFGAIFPIIAPFMYHPGGNAGSCPVATCGVHVGPAISGAIALLFLPVPWYFYRNGARIRKHCRYAKEADKILTMMIKPIDSPVAAVEKAQSPQATAPAPTLSATTDAAEELRRKEDLEEQADSLDRCQ